MKKILLILSACLCFFTSCQQKQELKPVNIKPITIEKENITIVSDPRLELLFIASTLADSNPFGKYNSDYTATIKTFFKNHTNHPLIKQIKKIYKKDTFNFDYYMIFNAISPDFTSISEEDLHQSGQKFWKKHINKFLINFNNFAHETNFEKFCLIYEATLKTPMFDAQEYFNVNKNIIPLYHTILNSQQNSQNPVIYCSNLFFNLTSSSKNQILFQYKLDIKNPYNPFFVICSLIFGDVHILLEKNWNQIKEPLTSMINKIYSENRISQKVKDNNALFMTADIISLYLTFHYMENDFSEEVRTEFYNYLKKFALTDLYPTLNPLFNEYSQNPTKYKNFEDFFNNYLVKEIQNFKF